MDKIRLKISAEEARAIVDALRENSNPTNYGLLRKVAERIEIRLIRHEFAYGNGADRTQPSDPVS